MSSHKAIQQFRNRRQSLLYLEGSLYAIGSAILVYFLTNQAFIGVSIFILVILIFLWRRKPWKITMERTVAFIDTQVPKAEYSAALLLQPKDNLTLLGQLQREKLIEELPEAIQKIRISRPFYKSLAICTFLIFIGFLCNRYDLILRPGNSIKDNVPPSLNFTPGGTPDDSVRIPEIQNLQIRITPPAYTGLSAVNNTEMNLRFPAGSKITWQMEFSGDIADVWMEANKDSLPFSINSEKYNLSFIPKGSQLYNLAFTDTKGTIYISEIHSLELINDNIPDITIDGIDQFTNYEYSDDITFRFMTDIRDDYGLGDIAIVATVGKGSGESIKFREERLEFSDYRPSGLKNVSLSKSIDLLKMGMEPGDELYFYVEASDLKTPTPQIARSDTYFAKLKDTATFEFAVEGNLGVDLMPDYFRSQRQLIIDTERLIKEKNKLPVKDFNSRSNELGFDQKALRLKYGQFMGDEAEDAIQPVGALEESHGDDENKDPLKGYKHDHDSENEQHLVPEKENKDGEDHEDPLEEYLHNHDDPEESTLFTQSLKTKLRAAMNEMWDSELQLRLFKPELSLPYQYSALKLLQEIKNSARIYVHRIGFDPPPIKEEKRLSGELKEISSYDKKDSHAKDDHEIYTRELIKRLEYLKKNPESITDEDKKLFREAGGELAGKAIEAPGNYLESLQQLKLLSEGGSGTVELFSTLQRDILKSLSNSEPVPGISVTNSKNSLQELLLKALYTDDE
ncbi:tryptophan-rich sensory protein [Robertkochia solimangrovi]|uniref:tryptophan-rich sensory protein n=1 Tax=Robertkochia solimangrovi TaxID=2213046 RepID=UPI00117F7BD0|nr:tryptophan-rich sensory protein [Robertkochia solimangrovi]TRZ43172.1 tryptophan-rich sensory protein [Robertkochia solimangrovi]